MGETLSVLRSVLPPWHRGHPFQAWECKPSQWVASCRSKRSGKIFVSDQAHTHACTQRTKKRVGAWKGWVSLRTRVTVSLGRGGSVGLVTVLGLGWRSWFNEACGHCLHTKKSGRGRELTRVARAGRWVGTAVSLRFWGLCGSPLGTPR